MPRPLLTPREVLQALRRKVYAVDLATGEVTRRGRAVTPFVKPSGRRLVRVYYGGKVKAMLLARLVWMAGANRTIPKGFEVHHHDEENDNDAFRNLFCLHKLDHRKRHAAVAVVADDEVPF
ncbi:MAG TPA: HNH endonuclease [Urbifossiella sp.]|nr:HNH endonuclease [Urbifossiella sp.]